MHDPAWPAAIGRPPGPDVLGPDIQRWAVARARQLIEAVDLVCDGRRHRIREVELYLHSARHPDPFVHRGSHQMRAGGWSFHRIGQSYRGGSFKGLDFASGGPDTACGWLLRTIEAPDGRLIAGSCNVVDHLLEIAGESGIAPLDTGSPDALDPASRLHLAPAAQRTPATIWTTPRVGLTLRRAADHRCMPAYIGRRLRMLDAPRRIKKGRVQTIAALLADGARIEAIRAVTGSPLAALRRAAAAFEAGRGRDPMDWSTVRPTAADLYGFYGATMTSSDG